MPENERHDQGGGARGWLLWLVLLVAAIAVTGFLAWRFPDALSARGDRVHLVYLLGLLALVSSGMIGARRLRLSTALRNGAIWVAIALVLAIGYSFRHDLEPLAQRLTGELLPHAAQQTGDRELTLRVGTDGHYRLEAEVDGVPIRFMVDTGASDVVLSPADARRLGFDPGSLRFNKVYETSNGTVRGAPVRLGEMRVGSLRLTDMPASVNEADMSGSLLGMRFLGQFTSFEFRDDALILRW